MRKLIIIKLSTFILMYSINWSIADERYLMIDPFSKNLKIIKEFRKNLSKPSIYPVTSMKLVGTIIGTNSENYALLKLPGDEDQVIIKQGQKIGKYKALVKKIDDDRVTIQENNNTITLGLNE